MGFNKITMDNNFKVGDIVWDCNRNKHTILEIRKVPLQIYVLENWLGITYTDSIMKIPEKYKI